MGKYSHEITIDHRGPLVFAYSVIDDLEHLFDLEDVMLRNLEGSLSQQEIDAMEPRLDRLRQDFGIAPIQWDLCSDQRDRGPEILLSAP